MDFERLFESFSNSLFFFFIQQQPSAPVRNQQMRVVQGLQGLQGHPVQPQQQVGQPHQPHQPHQPLQGSMTPLSYAKWQHSCSQPAKRYNPLYDTPPTQRHQPPVLRPQGKVEYKLLGLR